MIRLLKFLCVVALTCLGLVVLIDYQPDARLEADPTGQAAPLDPKDRGSSLTKPPSGNMAHDRVSADESARQTLSLTGVDADGMTIPFQATIWSLSAEAHVIGNDLEAPSGLLEIELPSIGDIWITATSSRSNAKYSGRVIAQELKDGRHEIQLSQGVLVSGELTPMADLIPLGGLSGVEVFVWPKSQATSPIAVPSLETVVALESTFTDSHGRFEFVLAESTKYCMFAIGAGLVSGWDGKHLDTGALEPSRQLQELPVRMLFGAKYSLSDVDGRAIPTSSDLFGNGVRVRVSEGLSWESSSKLPRAFFPGLQENGRATGMYKDAPVIATASSRIVEKPSATVSTDVPGYYERSFEIALAPLNGPRGEGLRIFEVNLSREYELGEVELTLTGSPESAIARGVRSRPGLFFVLFEHVDSRKIFRWDPESISLGIHRIKGLPAGEYLCGISSGFGLGEAQYGLEHKRLVISPTSDAKVEFSTDLLRFLEIQPPGNWPESAGEPVYVSVRAVSGGWSKAAAFTDRPLVVLVPRDVDDVRIRLRRETGVDLSWTEVPSSSSYLEWH